MNTLSLIYRYTLKIIVVLSLIALSVSAKAGFMSVELPNTETEASIQGTFFQLLNSHANWTPKQWQELFLQFKKLHLKKLILQWSVHDRTAFFPSESTTSIAHPPLNLILEAADKAGIQVWVGLVEDPLFWKKTNRPSPEMTIYFKDLLERSINSAQELSPILSTHSSFQGWYITQEVDDLNWRTPQNQTILFDYLNVLSMQLHAITPKADIAISGFANTGTDPQFLETFWSALLQKAPFIYHVFFQDGIGAHKLNFKNLPSYLKAMHTAVTTHSRTLDVVIEIFDQKSGEAGAFQASPASMERISQQISISAPYSQNLIAFSVPEYMLSSGQGPETLFKDYLQQVTLKQTKLPITNSGSLEFKY